MSGTNKKSENVGNVGRMSGTNKKGENVGKCRKDVGRGRVRSRVKIQYVTIPDSEVRLYIIDMCQKMVQKMDIIIIWILLSQVCYCKVTRLIKN